jgi:hypothetical protein
MELKIRFIRNIILTGLSLLFSLGLAAQTILIPEDATWKYLDDGSNQDSAWKELSYEDDSWDSGPAELGYGDGGEATILNYGPNSNNKYITYYFRHNFIVSESISVSYLLLRVQRDDGVVVYLNGNEICRSNMPSGTINYLTLASTAVGSADESTFFEFLIPSDDLVTGTNLLAAEIHQSSITSSDISFNLELSTTELPQFHKEPYLFYAGSNTEMTVLWQLYENCPNSLSWGITTDYSMGNEAVAEYGPDHQYIYTINGLTPSTKYYYRVIANTDTITGHFLTAPGGEASKVAFFAYGDTRTNPLNHDTVAGLMVQNYTADPDAQGIAILSGDLVSDGNAESKWDEQFFSPDYINIREFFRTMPVISAKGNHEGTGAIFRKYFPYPYYTSGSFYWSFDYGPVHICVVDQYTSYDTGTAQYSWITADLAATDKPWKFLLFHEPGWSAGGGHSNNTAVQNVLQPLCLEYGVQFVINGHNHYYSRAEVSGVEHITTGGGGAPLKTPNPTSPNIVTTSSSHHFCKIHIDTDTLHFTVIKDDGTVIESFDYHNYHEWTGATDNNWNNASNWSKGTVPGEGWNVVIPQGLSNYPQISGSASCKFLQLEPGTWITVLNGSTLNVQGQLQDYGTMLIREGTKIFHND